MAIQDLIDDAIQLLTIWMHWFDLLQQLERWYGSLVLEATTYTRDIWGGQCGMEWQQSICSGMIYWPCFLSISITT